jgi:2-oxoglutarate ferredoxin oxidoreductase subunit beta
VTSISKPKVQHPSNRQNALGLTRRDYEGSMSTLCAGCGHDSVTAALIDAFWRRDMQPHRVVKLSGIGCSSKTTAYFINEGHGFNAVHGRMPAVATGAAAANRDLHYVGISGDGDSLSIGLGQMCHAIRRNVPMLYVLENNGVYGLTKGQFSASADVGSKSKRGEPNLQQPIDPVLLALSLGATFVARSFSGDKGQLVPIFEAGLKHKGFALVDVISPCVTFNDHEASTKSYLYTRQHYHEIAAVDFVPLTREIRTDYAPGERHSVTMHDGSTVHFRKLEEDYDPTDRAAAMRRVSDGLARDEVMTGLFYINTETADMHELNKSAKKPLVELPFEALCPGGAALDKLMAEYR